MRLNNGIWLKGGPSTRLVLPSNDLNSSMQKFFLILTLGISSVASRSALCGEIRGSVKFPGHVDRVVSPAVVYVVAGNRTTSSSGDCIVVDQRNLQFVPRVQAMAMGDSIIFRNSDREAHNVNSQSGCCSFNYMVGPLGATGPGESEPIQPPKAGLVKLLCNIHQHMRGYVMVCPSSLFAVTDAEGAFRISGVPNGRHKVVVWQELSKPFTAEVEVEGVTEVEFELLASEEFQRPAAATAARPAVPWTEVLRRIVAKFEAAIETAQKPDGAKQAERLALDAYFEHFEASELETAVRLFRGEERVFVIERMFMNIRRPLLSDLAAARTDSSTVQAAVAELTRAIEDDIRELDSRRIFDRNSLGFSQAPVLVPVPKLDSTGVRQVLTDLRRAFDDVERLAASGNSTGAASALADSYFQVFHRIEPALAATNFSQMRKIEGTFLNLRGRLQSGMPAPSVKSDLDSLWSEIDQAAAPLKQPNKSGFASALNGFWNSFVILTREGVEALLIVTALLIYLNRMGRPDDKRVIYAGLIVALFATVLTWIALQWLIAQSGLAQETIEGVAALAAAVLLFYVSYWLISKSEARRWQEFLTRQVGASISTGGKWAIGVAAFLAVYREGAETILMFQPMLVNPKSHELAGVVAGILAAVVALAAVFWALRFASFRLAIRPFFRVTGALLFVLSVVFAGKGVRELQEAGLLAISPLPSAMHSVIMALPSGLRDALAIAPTNQSVLIQGTIVFGAMISLAAIWLVGWLTPVTPPAARTKSVKRKRSKTAA